ncbi:MAG: transporter substrate-binding domain-containing protein [Alphaproteobacteria bacterium]|nr:transporter substrate-binding domain-containing protein [Alphaproteobacteria bacterium]MBU6472382.1 transporter substrate-binding domain-containing protein [Alphaproteobacteria bacterium]MDE2351645.1 transporter substrate-binding domain-containing protein [Alphaproteobacteria bacterium]
MSSRCTDLLRASCTAAALVLLASQQAGAAPAPAHSRDVRICIDSGSPAAAINRKVARAVAYEAHWPVSVVATRWNRPGDDDGVSPRAFAKMAATRCDFIMGYPMSAGNVAGPAGLQHTGTYLHTGDVLVGRGTVPKWSALPKGASVGVTYNTLADVLLAEHGGLDLHVFDTERETVAAVRAGKVPLALVWNLSLDGQARKAGGLTVRRLGLPQAEWVLVALYADRDAALGKAFDTVLERLRRNGRLARLTEAANPPAGPRLYTDAQANDGAKLFASHCASCHGAELQGNVGPALRGAGFAGPTDGFTVGAMFSFFSVQMPAGAPGSLKHDEYTSLMAFLLRENGYPSGDKPLTYDDATASQAPLVSRVDATPSTGNPAVHMADKSQ